jgi:predicted CopG family antitoxin
MAKEEITTIQISKEARDELRELGKMGETYDDVIKKLIKKAKECEKKNG